MSEVNANTYPIYQLLLKPAAEVQLDAKQHFTDEYMVGLQETLTVLAAEAGCNAAAGINVRLEYVRPMSGGVHVLNLLPALELTLSKQVSDLLAMRGDVEYAEPDLPRRR